MPQGIKTTLDFLNVGKIVNLPDGVNPQDAATVAQLGSVSSSLKFKGTWNASTNIITSSDSTLNGSSIPAAASGNEGYYLVVSMEGTTDIDGIEDWKVDDWIVSTGAAWIKVNNSGSAGGGAWGTITGTLSDQTDLQSALDVLQDEIDNIGVTGNKLFNYYNFI